MANIRKERSMHYRFRKLTAASTVVVIALVLCPGCTTKPKSTAATIEDVWATIEQHNGANAKGVLPADVPEYPGWRGAIADSSDGVIDFSASTSDEPSKVLGFYLPKLQEAGWKVSQPLRDLPDNEHATNSKFCSFLKGNRGVALFVAMLRPQRSLAAHTSIDIQVYDSVPEGEFGPDKVFAPRSTDPSTSQSKTN
jgi:hypothetical protein